MRPLVRILVMLKTKNADPEKFESSSGSTLFHEYRGEFGFLLRLSEFERGLISNPIFPSKVRKVM